MKLTTPDSCSVFLRSVHLLEPSALREEAGCMRQDASEMTGYALALTLPDEVVTQIESPTAPRAIRLAVFQSPREVPTLCLACHVGNTQIRVLGAANDAAIQTWLHWLSMTGRVQLLIDVEETQQAVWVRNEIGLKLPHDLLKTVMVPNRLDPEEVRHEVVSVASRMALPSVQEFLLPGCEIETLAIGLLHNGMDEEVTGPPPMFH